MSSDDASRITRVLNAVAAGDRADAASDLLPLVYSTLRARARAMLAGERPGQTLQPTALVHEAYLRVIGSSDPGWDGRKHFYAAAAEAMRRILIDQATRKKRLKHGGGRAREELEEDAMLVDEPDEDLLAVDEALRKLEAADSSARQLVNLRYFSGHTIREVAEILGRSVATVEREWAFVRAWLGRELNR